MTKKVKVDLEELNNLVHDFKKYYSLTMNTGKKIMDEFDILLSHMENNGESK